MPRNPRVPQTIEVCPASPPFACSPREWDLGSERPVLLSRGLYMKFELPRVHRMHERLSPSHEQTIGTTRHALVAERIRIRHLEKALACAADGLFRERCEAELASSRMRELELERTLRMDANAHGHSDVVQMDECLLSAMDMARANGDVSAAEAVAQECLALVEMHCRTLLDTGSREAVDWPRGQASFSEGAVES